MEPSKDCLAIIEASEGLRLRAYRDTGNVLTIGYGHTGGVKEGQVITIAIAEALLKHDIEYAAGIVESHAGLTTQSQFDALVDFVFNVGPSHFLSSHLYKYHKAGQYDKAAAEFPKWKYDNGKVEPGLVARRAAEQALYSRQEPEAIHPHTDEPVHSASPVEQPGSPPNAAQSSPAPPAPISSTAPVSGTGQSEFLSQALGLVRNLLKPKPKP